MHTADADATQLSSCVVSATWRCVLNSQLAHDNCQTGTTDKMQLNFTVGKFVQTHRDCRQLAANSVHNTDATQLDSYYYYYNYYMVKHT